MHCQAPKLRLQSTTGDRAAVTPSGIALSQLCVPESLVTLSSEAECCKQEHPLLSPVAASVGCTHLQPIQVEQSGAFLLSYLLDCSLADVV